jgi:hypothetical protein
MEELLDIPINNWESIPIDVLKKTYDEIKENMGYHFSEIQSTTQKMIQLLTIFIPFISASYLFLIAHNSPIKILIILSLIYLATIILGFFIIKGHSIHITGSTPDNFLSPSIDGKHFSDKAKEKLTYKYLIELYWYKVNEMTIINSCRVRLYDWAIISAMLSFILTGIFIGLIYSHHVYFLS